MSSAMVSSLENWKELFKTPPTKAESCGITRASLIKKALWDVAKYEFPDGTNTIEVIHRMISEYLPIDYEDDNEYVLDTISVGVTEKGKDPFLSKTLGEDMLKWAKEGSGLMDYMPFRILLGSQVLVFVDIIKESFPTFLKEIIDDDLVEFSYDSLKNVAFNEHKIMPYLMVPLFLCYREKLRNVI